ncbi:MAG: NADH-quinone oxidoreductase subunit L [Proteobacteria bacterium]|nr:NADH-quinone oxidoreductase subunit L [Pseudomonadota bacterium]
MLELIYSHVSLQAMIWLVVAMPLAAAAASALVAALYSGSESPGPRPLVSLLSVCAPLGSLAATAVIFFTLTGFDAVSPSAITGPLFRWAAIPGFSVDVGLRVDELAMFMAALVAGVGFLVQLYSIGDMWNDDGFFRYHAVSSLLIFFMLLAVLADNLVLAIAGWEGVGFSSCALIGSRRGEGADLRSGLRAFAINAIGDASLLAAAFVIFGAMSASGADADSGLFNFETMERQVAFFMPVASAVALLIFGAAAAKSAQIPLHLWMPEAALAPTPAFALMGTVTTAALGVYMVIRLNYIFALAPAALSVMAWAGAACALLSATMALAERDLRRILAYSTVSQFGLIYMAAGMGAFIAASFHLATHALFKCLLVLSAGSAIKASSGESDVLSMGGLVRRMPITGWAFVVSAAAMAGIAPASGFFSEQAILGRAFERGHVALWIMGLAALGVTAFYIFRAAGAVFFGDSALDASRYKRVAEPSMSMVLATMLLISLVAGAGFAGLPHCLGGSDWIGGWLGTLIPSESGSAFSDGSCGTWMVLAAVFLLWSAHFAVLGWLIYAQKRDWPARVARRIRPLAQLAARKYYFEEICGLVIVGPVEWFARVIVKRGVDRTAIDGIAAGGVARTVGLGASIARAAQSGMLYHYMLYFLIGAVAIIALVAL